MRDAIEVELNIGDEVAYITGGNGGEVYLTRGYIASFTAKNIRVKTDVDRPGTGFLIKPSRLVRL